MVEVEVSARTLRRHLIVGGGQVHAWWMRRGMAIATVSRVHVV